MKVLLVLTTLILCLSNPIIICEDIQVETVTVKIEDIHSSVRTVNVETLECACPYSEDEIDLIALVTLAEAEGECEEGKRLVIDTILNRIDSSYFPDTVNEVIYQKNQFSSMWNGRCNRVTVTDDIRELVREEIKSRQNSDVMFFTAEKYGAYGVPMFSVGNHYFSSYK